MTYIPQVQGHSDLAYFEGLGLIGGSTGMAPIISVNGADTFPTADETRGTAAAITNNTLNWGAASADSWQGYNLGATYTRLLTIRYAFASTAQYNYILHNKEVLDNSEVYAGVDNYMAANNAAASPGMYNYKYVSSSFTITNQDLTIWQGTSTVPLGNDPAMGMAFYTSYIGSTGSQRVFYKQGSTANWIPVTPSTDTVHQEFKSIALWTLAKNMRVTTPFMVWGA